MELNYDGFIPGLGKIQESYRDDLIDLETTKEELWRVGVDGVLRILTTLDRKVVLIIFRDKTLVQLNSSLGYPGIYRLPEISFDGPAEAVLMDLDGTTIRSESFWIRVIELTTRKLMGDSCFRLEPNDEPFISGHSVSEHLQYCIHKYCPNKSLEEARVIYYEITQRKMDEVLHGDSEGDLMVPSPYLGEFLTVLKQQRIKIGLVTSGLYEKAWPEIVMAFKKLKMGDPLDFYDAIITGGYRLGKGRVGTLGELTPKPHPWLYAETAIIGLGLDPKRSNKIIGIEDSAAGIIAIRLAGFTGIGMKGGNISSGGARPFMHLECQSLLEALSIILGK